MTTPLDGITQNQEYRSIELDEHVLLSIDNLVKVFFRKGDHSCCLPLISTHHNVLRSPECIPQKSVSLLSKKWNNCISAVNGTFLGMEHDNLFVQRSVSAICISPSKNYGCLFALTTLFESQ